MEKLLSVLKNCNNVEEIKVNKNSVSVICKDGMTAVIILSNRKDFDDPVYHISTDFKGRKVINNNKSIRVIKSIFSI